MRTRLDVFIVFLLLNLFIVIVRSESKETCPEPVKNEIESPEVILEEKQNEKSCRKISDPDQPSIVIKG